jgi:hypothetical protein
MIADGRRVMAERLAGGLGTRLLVNTVAKRRFQ